ncbi:MAG: glycosyl hydrolase 108 family protein [Thermodesulfobacteriota bacterium]|nr:glycosyl hydrolase 108 family protein [Thermodesulfobacteriota bacterium]
MAKFESAFQKTMKNEGGYQLHEVEGDRGGMTYAGIARRFHPGWSGWEMIDTGQTNDPKLTLMVRRFYKVNFWQQLRADHIESQQIAESVYDFAVNAGVRVAVTLAQLATGATPDGIVGPKTIDILNNTDPDVFTMQYVIAKISRYAAICNQRPAQKKFLLGWINRTLKGVS